MGFFGKKKLLNGLKRVGLGLTDALGVSSILKSNLDSKHKTDEQGNPTGMGKIDYIRLVVAISTIIGFILVLTGKADMETLKGLLKMLY